MPIQTIPLEGKRFSRLMVINRVTDGSPGQTRIKWVCQCDCGNSIIAWGRYLHNGVTKSCGCLSKEDRLEKAKLLIPAGTVFGKLTVLSILPSRSKGKAHDAQCQCECGSEKRVLLASLKSGQTQSCGCMGGGVIKHGLVQTPEYRAWQNMKIRCVAKPGDRNYIVYGARGITVAKEWTSWENGFVLFLEHVGKRPTPKHSLDRIDTNGNYEPGNVRWATSKEQCANRRIKRIENFSNEDILNEIRKRGLLNAQSCGTDSVAVAA